MADDVNPARRAELQAHLAVLEPQIRGLRDLAKTTLTGGAFAVVNEQIETRDRRRTAVLAELANLNNANSSHDALIADGYPSLPQVEVIGAVFRDLQEEETDIQAAVSIFTAQSAAAGIVFGAPTVADKPAA